MSFEEGGMVSSILRKMVKVGELDIHYLTGGQGDPLLVIHGGSIGAIAWQENMVELLENYTVYVPDLLGFGDSQSFEGDYFIPEMARFVDEFSHKLGLESFHLMGHSLGGGIALSYALSFPHKIKKLVLVSSMCLGREIALWVRFLSSRVLCRAIGGTTLVILRGVKRLAKFFYDPVEFAEPFCRASIHLGSSLTSLTEQTMVFLNRLSEIMVPTLVIWGAKDPIVPFQQAYAAAQLIPDCQVKVFDDCGHSVYRQKIPEFSRLLSVFLG
ncbi:alpha/beta fold hydrolase [Chloroflexota bacterium]